ncbi:MAG: SpoIVB peptidase [Clostridia bacterium]|nr:SpoIVB peptidase [Clostridia bacterium]
MFCLELRLFLLGNIAGVKLYTSGILVVGMSEIEGVDNKKHKPYENSGIEEGDSIISIDNTKISTTQDLIDTVNASSGKNLAIEYVHNNATATCSITPVQTSNNEYKLGLWVRDSAAGVGTVTFYDSSTKSFGALGHGITDIDTEELINIESGEFITTQILNIKKGENGYPGRIQGTIDNQTNIGSIYKNTKFGIYGKVSNPSALRLDSSKEMEVALREEIKEGPATILCNLDGTSPKEYNIQIERIFRENNYDNKSMKIKVTDENLLNKTGGIIQGMSGSPVIQNGKFVGAVTHVLVNNPKEGYAVFGDIMLKQIREVN